MERNDTTLRHRNPKFAILGLSHVGGRHLRASEWSSSLSVSCFGQSSLTSVASADHDERMEPVSPLPTRLLYDNVVARKTSSKGNRRRLATSADRRQDKPPPSPGSSSSSQQVPAVSCSTRNQRPSHSYPKSTSLSSESLIIRPLRGDATCSTNSSNWPSTRRTNGLRSRTKTVTETPSRRDVVLMPSTTVSDNDGSHEPSTTAGRHLDVFLPSLVARQTVESDE